MTRAKTNRSPSWSVRYYLCSGDEVTWRIPNTLHCELVSGKLALPQFAGTRQRVLEAFFRSASTAATLLDARGSIYSFAPDGKLNQQPPVEALASIIEGDLPRCAQGHVIDVGPTVRYRRWVNGQTWQPTPNILRAVRADLRASGAADAGKVPSLKRISPQR